MLLLEKKVVDRVRPALDALGRDWTTMGLNTDPGRRDARPLASVAFFNGNVADSKALAASVEVAYRITVSATRGPDAAGLIDTAVDAVVAAVLGWGPGEVGGRHWDRFRLLQVSAPQYADDALAGVLLTFVTVARFEGQD